MTIPKPFNPYFLVRTERVKEKEAKTKIGSLYVSEVESLMQYTLAHAEIVDISEKAAQYFPEAKIGHQLLMHHFVLDVSEHEAKEEHLVHQDEIHNYYVVSSREHNGKGTECYGVWDGEKIIPNKDFVFLQVEKTPVNDLPAEEMINQALEKTTTGLFLFKEWKESRDDKEAKQASLKKEVEELTKSGTNKQHIQQAIRGKEAELELLSKDINRQMYKPYTVAYANKELSEWFGTDILEGDRLAVLNFAAQTTIKFMGQEYIVCQAKYIACLYDKRKAAA